MPRILHRTGTRAAINAAAVETREPWFASDYARQGVGPVGALWSPICHFYDELHPLTYNSATDQDIALYPGFAELSVEVECDAGSVPYTCNLGIIEEVTGLDGLTTINPVAGDRYSMKISFAASANPTLLINRIVAGSDDEVLLLTLTGDAGKAQIYTADFNFRGSGGGWTLWRLTKWP